MQVMFLSRRQENQARATGTRVKSSHILLWDKSSISFANLGAMLRAAEQQEDENPSPPPETNPKDLAEESASEKIIEKDGRSLHFQ